MRGFNDERAQCDEWKIQEGSKDLFFVKLSNDKKIPQIAGKEFRKIIELAKTAQKLIFPLTRRINDKRLIEQAALIAALCGGYYVVILC